MWKESPRVIVMSGKDDKIPTTAEVMEMARDIGRKWGDLHEIFVWEDGVKLLGNRLYYFQAIHQESDVIPENVDCVRALMGTEADWRTSVAKTDFDFRSFVKRVSKENSAMPKYIRDNWSIVVSIRNHAYGRCSCTSGFRFLRKTIF